MANMTKSLGRHRDIPQLESAPFAALAAGSATDPSVDTTIFAIPDLKLSFVPSGVGQGAYADQPNNRQVQRQVALISQGSSNTVGNATNNADIRINVYRAGKLQGCIAYYTLSINTTVGSLVQMPVNTSSTTTVSSAGSATITVASAANIVVGTPLYVTGGTGTAEWVTVSSVSGTSVTATFANTHSGTYFLQTASVNTTASTAVSPGSVAVTPASMAGIAANEVLYISGGVGTPEYVLVASVTSTTFTATFVNSHTGTYTVTSASLAQSQAQLQGVVGLAYPLATAVIPTSVTGIMPGMALGVGSGATFEIVYVQQLVGTIGFLANFAYSHATSEALTTVLVPQMPIAMVPAYGVSTTSSTAVSAAGSTQITPARMYGIHVGDYLAISGGTGTAETVQVTAVTNTTFTATFANTHSGTYNIASSATTIGQNTVGVNAPFELQGGDVVTVNRISNNTTGIATPLILVQSELVPSGIKA